MADRSNEEAAFKLAGVRALAPAERALLPVPLARAIDLDAVRILARWHSPVAAYLKVTIVRGPRIFWKHAPVEAQSLSARAHLVHELVHVWQYRALRRTGVELLASRLYRYRFDPARTFLSYGYEQQAAMVEDWFLSANGAEPRWSIEGAPSVADYEKVISTASNIAP